ncbi:hypothetical protein C8Q79DRAFT_905886 [Trametes meyenii]|nr:hypothetical protein C8Q79DRAFT_905886 [Trametes meyenii]
MHAFTTLITFLALGLASVSAAPLHHRRTCRPHSQISVASSVISTSAISQTSEVVSTAVAAISTDATSTKVSSTKAPSTTIVSTESTSTKASGVSSTKASSTAAPAATSATSGSTSSLLKKLFPIAHSKFWTTSTSSPDALPLDDATLGVTKLLKALSHDYVKAPDGKYSMKAFYPQGSYTPAKAPGGLSFYATGPSSVDLENAKEATLAYSVYFEDDFAFNKGGKLPGLYGGDSYDIATSCSGGRRDDRCFSARFMWREQGEGELYTYLPPSFDANKAVCDVKPFSTCNDVYGASVGRGAFSFKAGTRTTIGQRVRLNDAGKENGELELFVEGKSIFNVKGLVFRDSDAGRFRGIQMQTFFGGSNSEWASPKDQSTYFSDFSVAITETL